MSEQAQENPNQAVQPGADDVQAQQDAPAPQAQSQAPANSSDETTFPLRLVKRPTGDVHWNTAAGVWETITHAETGEPTQEYALLATIDGQDVTLASYNAGRIDSRVQSARLAQQQSGS